MLGQLHNVIQGIMGLADEHLHTFGIRVQALRRKGFVYVYDFNAWWRHEMRMERPSAATAWPDAPLRGGLRALPARGHWRDREVSGGQG